MAQAKYQGKVAALGNSKALRLEAGFFKSHPLFASGAVVDAQAIGEGVVIIRAKRTPNIPETDPVMDAFLAFIEQDMTSHPETIQPMSTQELDEIASLVEGVEID
jgi:hypothetical protein